MDIPKWNWPILSSLFGGQIEWVNKYGWIFWVILIIIVIIVAIWAYKTFRGG